jgi:hypothetical protein
VLSGAPDQVSKVRQLAAPHSGSFLRARPYSSLGTRLDDSSLRISVAFRLGAPVCAPKVAIADLSSTVQEEMDLAAANPLADCHVMALSMMQ